MQRLLRRNLLGDLQFRWRFGRILSNAGERTTTNSGFARLPADIEWAFILHADDVVKPNWISLYWNEMIGCADDIATICSSYDIWDPECDQIHAGEEFPDKPSVLVKGTRAAVLNTLNRGCWWHISGLCHSNPSVPSNWRVRSNFTADR